MGAISVLGVDVDTTGLQRAQGVVSSLSQAMQETAARATSVERAFMATDGVMQRFIADLDRAIPGIEDYAAAMQKARSDSEAYAEALQKVAATSEEISAPSIDPGQINSATAQINSYDQAINKLASDAEEAQQALSGLGAKSFGKGGIPQIPVLGPTSPIGGNAAAIASDMEKVATQSKGAAQALVETGVAAEKAAVGLRSPAASMRELLVLIHEAASGNWRRVPGSALIEVQNVAGVQGAIAVLGVLAATAVTVGSGFAVLNNQLSRAFGKDSDLSKGLGLTKDQIDKLKEDEVSLGVTFGDRFKATFETMFDDLKKAMSEQGKAAQSAFNGISDFLAAWFPKVVGWWAGLFSASIKVLTDFESAVIGTFGNVFIGLYNAVAPAITKLFEVLRGPLNAYIDGFNAVFHLKIPDVPAVNFQPMKEVSHAAFTDIAKDAANTFKQVSSSTTSYLDGLFPRIEDRARKDRIKEIQDDLGKGKRGAVPTDTALNSLVSDISQVQAAYDKLSANISKGLGDISIETPLADLEKKDLEALKALRPQFEAAEKALHDAKTTAQKDAAQQALDSLKTQQSEIMKDFKNAGSEAGKEFLAGFQATGKLDVSKLQLSGNDYEAAVYAEQIKLTAQSNKLKSDGYLLTKQELDAQTAIVRAKAEGIVKDNQDQAVIDKQVQIQQQAQALAKVQSAIDTGSYENYQLAVKINDLRKEGKIFDDAKLQNLAQQEVAEQRIADLENIRIARLKAISETSSLDKASSSLDSASDSFWTNFLANGNKAFGTLGTSLKQIFTSVAADGLRAGFEPVLNYLKDTLRDVFSSVFEGVKDSFSSVLKQAGILGSDGKFATSGFGAIIGTGVQAAASGFAGQQIGQSLAGLAGGARSPEQQQNSLIGAGLTATLGALAFGFGPIGFALDAILGGLVGGLLGPSSTNAGAGQGLFYSGENNGPIQGNKRTDQTTQLLQAVTGAIKSGYQSIAELGGTRTTYVTGVTVGQRDPSAISLSNGQGLSAQVGDAAAAANVALLAVLKDTTFAVQGLNQIKDAMIAAGSSFDDTSKVLSSVKSVLDSVAPPVSSFSKALTDLENQFDPLIKSANDASAALLKQAEATAKAQLASAFDTDIQNKLLAAQSSVASQYKTLLETQASRIKDATALNADMNAVLQLNQQETTNFINSLFPAAKATDTITSSIQALTDAFQQLSKQTAAAGNSTDELNKAYANALGQIQDTFNQQTADALLSASNPTLGQLESILKTQKQRLDDAKALGVDITASERLNAIELNNFFSNLSDQQKASLGDYLGLITDYTGQLGVVGAQLQMALDPLVTNINTTIQNLQTQATTMQNLATTIGQTKDSIDQQYSGKVPVDQIAALRAKLQDESQKALGGDTNAAGQLSTTANALITLSRSLYGSTGQFTADFNMVDKILGDAQASAQSQADKATQQIAALQTQISILTEIKTILGSSTPAIDTLTNDLGKLDDSFTDVKSFLSQYLQLQQQAAAQTLSDAQLQQLTLLISSTAANTTAVNQAISNANATGQPATGTVAPTGTAAAATGSTSEAALTAGYFQLLLEQIKDDDSSIQTTLSNILNQMRLLVLYTQQAKAA